MGIVVDLSDALGTSVPAIKLLLTVYAGYIFSLIHRSLPFKKNAFLKFSFFSITGLTMLYWNYGFDLYHSLLCIFVQYLIFVILGGSVFSVATSFAFQLGYLIYGYVFYSTTGYDINWCMPHCILTLRLIGLAFDVYDGHRKEEALSSEQKETAIKDFPSLLEIMGFSYMCCGFLVGPQFPLQRVRSMINGELTDNPGNKPNSLLPGFRRCLSGTLVLGVQTYLASTFFPMFYTTPEFQESGFFYKAGYIAITGHVTLLQYVAVWMINEGSCIICGLGYREDKKTGKVYWDAVRNVSLHNFLMARSFQDEINAFNINTNGWIMKYVYKRLRFVGIRQVSQVCALAFLAIWHGIHEGYMTCFLYEFLTMNVEKPMLAIAGNASLVKNMKSNTYLRWIPILAGFVYLHGLLGYCLIDLSLRKWHLYQPVHASVYCHGYVFFISMYILIQIRGFFLQAKKPENRKI